MQHMLGEDNIGLVVCRQMSTLGDWRHAFISNTIIEKCYISNKGKEGNYLFPLYITAGSLKPEMDADDTDAPAKRVVNFNHALHQQLIKLATHPKHGTPDDYAIFDYIYGVLHCPSYRQKYSEWLKVDFPRIPFPKSPDMFWDVSQEGTKLRKLHLMESTNMPSLVKKYPFVGKGDANPIVEKHIYNPKTKRIYINDAEYFAEVPEVVWEMFIGGYQPAQSWLKSRKDMRLNHDNVQHYRHILVVLAETHRIMHSITLD